MRRYVIERIPGAWSSEPDDDARRDGAPGSPRQQETARREWQGLLDRGLPAPLGRAPRDDAIPLSSLLGRTVLGPDGEAAGRISELGCHGGPADGWQKAMTVAHVQYMRHLAGSNLGYTADRHQGPALLRWTMRRWNRR